ncbi:MAG: insulinase family protein [Bacteroidales bacterium]|nr:insulinase family protein [Bacteroidales bacterium]
MYRYHTLDNGVKVILSPSDSKVTYSGVYINVGARDEQGLDEGIAHFIEHSIFKGTTHRKAYHILNRIDGVGGELNAFTTKEETCIYASSLSQHLERCIELFSDILFYSTFPDKEIEKEQDVVLEEINSYSDSPSELIYDQYEELAFAGHSLSHNILGSKRNVRHFTPQQIRRFMAGRYVPQRMVVSVVGNINFDDLVKMCEKHFGHHEQQASVIDRSTHPQFQIFDKQVNRHTHQAHLLTGCEAPNIYSNQRAAFSLINNILGGPAMNSWLNVSIRERYGFCYTIESQYVPFSDTGLFYIYAGIDHESVDKTRMLVAEQLRRIAETPLTPTQLRQAKLQMIGQMAITNDTGLNEMQSIGKAYLNYDKVDSLEEMATDINSLSASDIQNVAQQYFSPALFSTLTYTH